MLIQEIRKNPVVATAAIAATMEGAPTRAYILRCLDLFFNGDYGETPPQDIEANNIELQAGAGRIVARYKAAEDLKKDIFIIAHFSDQEQGNDYNYTTIMYTDEY